MKHHIYMGYCCFCFATLLPFLMLYVITMCCCFIRLIISRTSLLRKDFKERGSILLIRAREQCESRGGRPGLPSLIVFIVTVNVTDATFEK